MLSCLTMSATRITWGRSCAPPRCSGARAVIATQRHAAPETGALAKTASGALERQPYLRVRNLAEEMVALQQMGYILIGLDGEGDQDLGAALASLPPGPVGLVLGAEGPGLRDKTRATCDMIARIPAAGGVRIAERVKRGGGVALRRAPWWWRRVMKFLALVAWLALLAGLRIAQRRGMPGGRLGRHRSARWGPLALWLKRNSPGM